MGGWNLPDDVSDNDPRAPWNQDDSHCPRCCPADEDSDWYDDPECYESGEPLSKCDCWYWVIGQSLHIPNRILVWIKNHLDNWGCPNLFPSYCNVPDEPPCRCCDCEPDEPDYEEWDDRERYWEDD